MSNTGAKEEKSSQGLGFFSSLLLAGVGGAAAGFLTHKFISEKNQPPPFYSNRTTSSGTGSSSNEKSDRKTETKKDINKTCNWNLCVVCLDNPREVILKPCNHVCLCEKCEKVITESSFDNCDRLCPICKEPIEKVEKIYMP